MSRGLLIAIVLVVAMVGSSMANTIAGRRVSPNAGTPPPADVEHLYQGDLGPEIGIGCSNASGTSGGPNYVAVGVTAALTPPFLLTSHFYNIFTQVSPNITALTLKIWANPGGGEPPYIEFYSVPGMDWTVGNHTAHIIPALAIPSSMFFMGHVQPQTDVGMRWGLDTSSPSAGNSFIQAPSCGLNVWGTVDSIGYPGNWVMSCTVEDICTPVELSTWGNVKEQYR